MEEETKVTETKEEDLVTKVSQVKLEPKKDDATFNVNDIDKIENPQAKEYAQKAYKSFESGYTKKFQALAEERKAWEAKKAEAETWTKDKVEALTKDPSFVTAAQSVAGQSDDYSALSDNEKKELKEAKTIAQQVAVQNAQLLKMQQDEANKTKYANYDSNAVDILTADLLKGKVQATREHLHKVLDYEDAVKRAYELGLQDKNKDNEEKITSMSAEGTVATGKEEVPAKEKNESDRSYIARLGLHNLSKLKALGQIRK